jgi:hypothetical protein
LIAVELIEDEQKLSSKKAIERLDGIRVKNGWTIKNLGKKLLGDHTLRGTLLKREE